MHYVWDLNSSHKEKSYVFEVGNCIVILELTWFTIHFPLQNIIFLTTMVTKTSISHVLQNEHFSFFFIGVIKVILKYRI